MLDLTKKLDDTRYFCAKAITKLEVFKNTLKNFKNTKDQINQHNLLIVKQLNKYENLNLGG